VLKFTICEFEIKWS